jgi:hypothetical protein
MPGFQLFDHEKPVVFSFFVYKPAKIENLSQLFQTKFP